MFLSERIEKAIVRATVLHETQRRKVSHVPYITHPYSVAFLLAHYVDDEDVIIAGLLHDVLEDVPNYSEKELREEFGDRVLSIVEEVTEDFTQAEKEDHSIRGAGWRVRKEKYLANLSDDSREAMLVAAADKIHNLRSIIAEYKKHGPTVWNIFRRDPKDMFWFYGEAARIISERLSHPLVSELKSVLEEAKRISKQNI